MKKIFTLFIAMTLGCLFFTVTATPYTVGAGYNEKINAGTVLSKTGEPVKVIVVDYAIYNKTADADALFPDNTPASEFGDGSIKMRDNAENSSKIKLIVDGTIENVRIYYTGESSSDRKIVVDGYNGVIEAQTPDPNYKYQSGSSKYEAAFVVNLGTLSRGTYYVYTTNFTGGFAGMKYDAETSGTIVDLFSTRVISGNTSEWKYAGYDNGTHGLTGGVEDNGIIYVSNSLIYDRDKVDNGNGNIKFSIDSSNGCYLSCRNKSTVYIPVPDGSSGTISMFCTATEGEKNKGTFINPARHFEFYAGNTYKGDLNMVEEAEDGSGGSSFKFSSSDLTTQDGDYIKDGSYIKLVSYYNSELAEKYGADYKDEMKVLRFKVTLDSPYNYTYTEPEQDYDHQIGEGHSHVIFNFTQGQLTNKDNTKNNPTDYQEGTLTFKGAKLSGKETANDDGTYTSGTQTIKAFRDGDLVKYKNQYYGALQLLSNADYTITAPEGKYITTSVRVHGYNNKDSKEKDTNVNTWVDTYVSSFNNGKFTSSNDDNTYVRYARDENGKTTTLDFTVPASKELQFSFSGYQFLGVIDVVLVDKNAVPSESNQVYYHKDSSDSEPTALADGGELTAGGTIKYTPKENEELWWYFSPTQDPYAKFGSRGCLGIQWALDGDQDQKDQNATKTFSVRNYKFVNASGSFDDASLEDVYNNPGNYFTYGDNAVNPQSLISTLADTPNDVSLKVNDTGYYYFYIRNKENNFNSPLVAVSFANTSGVEDVVVEDEMTQDDENAPIYNVYGQRVDSNYRGIVIKNGRKYYQK